MKHRLLAAFAVLSLAATASAQTPPCDALNDASNSVTGNLTAFGFAGQNTRAYRYTPTTSYPLQAVRLFTGNTSTAGNYMIVQVWSDVAGLPGTELASGTWRIRGSRGDAWQGASLDRAVPLVANTQYWIAFIDPGFSTLPEQGSGVTTQVAVRNGAAWVAAGNAQPKLRLYCGYLDDVGVAAFGPSCAGSTGLFVTTHTNEAPAVGNGNFMIEGSGLLPARVAILVLGVNPAFPSVPLPGILPPGCAENVDVFELTIGASGTGTTRSTTAAGHVWFALPIPPDPTLAGGFASVQVGASDPAFAVPIAFTAANALHLTVF